MKMFSSIAFFNILLLMNVNASAVNKPVRINYKVTFPEAQAHYVNVEMNITNLTQKETDIKMPVWTPGSYLVREFAKNVEGFEAHADGHAIATVKINKNTWRVENGKATTIKITYRVYAFEVSVRTSFVDAASGFLSTSGIFMYPAAMLHEPSIIHIEPYKGWTTVSTSLEPVNKDPFTVYAPNFDILFDSPIQVGTQDVFGFNAAGIKYEVAMCGGGNYDKERLTKDMTQIIEEETSVFKENPNKRYLFIVHNYVKGGGGLEHLSSTVLGASREGYTNEANYQRFLSLVAHEHFHLWNVKRLRPIVLGPFDYDNENYTTNLWIAEGFTAYYDNLIIRRTNLYPADNYLAVLADDINSVENQPGVKIQSLSESSFDAWIKAYRPDENSGNTTISYYSKGSIIALLLDLEIIHNTKGAKCLDDVMKYMYDTYYKLKKRGYTDAEFKRGFEKFTGKNLDEFYSKYINGVNDIDYNGYLAYAGYKLTNELADKNDPYLGVKTTALNNGKIYITSVARNSPAWVDGLNVNDELIALDDTTLKDIKDVNKVVEAKKIGEIINVNLIRDGIKLVIPVTLLKNPQVKYKIVDADNLTPEQLAMRKKWLKLP